LLGLDRVVSRIRVTVRVSSWSPTALLARLLSGSAFCLVLPLYSHWIANCAEGPASRVVGVVVLSKDTTVAGAPLLSGQNILADTSLEVGEGATEITTVDGGRLILGPHTKLSLARDGSGTGILLNQGNLTFAQTGFGNGFEVRAGNVSVLAKPSVKTRAVLTMTSQSLVIATAEGSVLVKGDGRQLDVSGGEAVRFTPDSTAPGGNDRSTQSGATASKSGAGGTVWGHVAVCSLGGAAIGSIPVIVNELSTSPDPDWRLGLIPVGAVGGGLICKEFWNSPGATCSLGTDRREINEGESVTLKWSAPPGYSAVITDVGDEPPVGKATITPLGEGKHTYELKATGVGGTLVCMADVNVAPKQPAGNAPKCTITLDPAKLDKPGDEVKVTWTLPPGTTEARLTRPPPTRDLLKEKQPLTLKLQERTQFLILGKSGGTDFICNTAADVTVVNCTLKATPQADNKTVRLSWTTENATSATLQAYRGDTSVGDPYDVPEGDLATGFKDEEPDRNVRYVLTVQGPPRPDKKCSLSVPVPTCDIWAKRITAGKDKDKYELQWRFYDTSSVKIDPEPDPKPKLQVYTTGTGNGKVIINPKTATTYTMTVTGGLGGKLVRTCTVDLKPTRCMLDAPPEVEKTSKTFPLKWSVENASSATIQTIVNGKPVGAPAPLDVDGGDASATIDQPTPKESTEYVVTVTGPGGAKSTCRACVTLRGGKGKTLPIQPATQKAGMWCWLTVGEMVFTYYKVPNLNPAGFYQCGIIGTLLPYLCGMDCTRCGSIGGGMGMTEFISDMLKKYPAAAKAPPINSDYVIRKGAACPLTEKDVKGEIDAGRPVIAGISTSGQHKYPPEHVALIVGYEEVDGKLRLRINDPYPFPADNDPYVKAGAQKNCGGSYYIDYETFCNKLAWDSAWWHIKPAGK
jgi:hypothetical protein